MGGATSTVDFPNNNAKKIDLNKFNEKEIDGFVEIYRTTIGDSDSKDQIDISKFKTEELVLPDQLGMSSYEEV